MLMKIMRYSATLSRSTCREKMDLRSSSITASLRDMLILRSGRSATNSPCAVSGGSMGRQSNTSRTFACDSSSSTGQENTISESKPESE